MRHREIAPKPPPARPSPVVGTSAPVVCPGCGRVRGHCACVGVAVRTLPVPSKRERLPRERRSEL